MLSKYLLRSKYLQYLLEFSISTQSKFNFQSLSLKLRSQVLIKFAQKAIFSKVLQSLYGLLTPSVHGYALYCLLYLVSKDLT